ncbi:MAG: alpha/beta hydrolase [Prochloraceae cyanobacterium]
MQYNRKAFRKVIDNKLTEIELDELLDDFSEVRNQFIDGQLKNLRTRTILDYFEKNLEEFSQLLVSLKENNKKAYDYYFSQLDDKNPTIEPKGESNGDFTNKTITEYDILILAANPNGTDLLQLNEEADRIKKGLLEGKNEKNGKTYSIKVEKAVWVKEISKYLLQYKPLVLHFSGHGSSSGEIILNNEVNEPIRISAETLGELLGIVQKSLEGRLECVVLNACFSQEKADAIAEQVKCVVGMSKEIDDESAISFSEGFYRGLGFGQGYYEAFKLGVNAIKLSNLPDSEVPRFFARDTSVFQSKSLITRTKRSDTLAEATLYPLWFGTNRKIIDSNNLSQGFSVERDNQLHYGTCQVAVPKSHKIGSTGSIWWQRLSTSQDDRLKLKQESLEVLNEEFFWINIAEILEQKEIDERSALVFIHGFNVSFEAAALRAAQIGFDLQVRGIMAFYSWPSQGKLTKYGADAATIEASEKYIAEFLLKLAQKSKVEKIHIIAHSMGNRGLLRAIQRISTQVQTLSDVIFGQIILAAPDLEPDLFRDLANNYQRLAERTTLYVSAKDQALRTSGIIHDFPRLGFYPPINVIEGIDTIEVSNIDLTLLGHGYFSDARDLLQDIHTLLINNQPPSKRFGLRIQHENGQTYWRIGG